MTYTMDTIVPVIRGDIGKPSQLQIDDTQIQRAVKDALLAYSRKKPLSAYRTLDIVPDVTTYVLEDDVIGLADFIYVPSVATEYSVIDATFNVYLGNYGQFPNMPGINIFNNPALQTIFSQLIQKYQKVYGNDYEYQDVEHEIILYRSPRECAKAVYVANLMHTLDTVPPIHEDMFLKYAEGRSKEIWGNNRNKPVTELATAGGKVKVDDGSRLISEGKSMMRDAFKDLGRGSVVLGG